jgi:hypothetical protein
MKTSSLCLGDTNANYRCIPSAGEMWPSISVPRIFSLGAVLRPWQLFFHFQAEQAHTLYLQA